MYVSPFGPQVICMSRDAYQVMTLSAMGEAETPAGGSVCMRCSGAFVSNKTDRGVLFVVRMDEKGFALYGSTKLLGAHSTLKSRMRRLRAGVVILKLWFDFKASFEMMQLFGMAALDVGGGCWEM